MKRFVSLLLVLVLCLSLISCASNSAETSQTTAPQETQPATEATVQPTQAEAPDSVFPFTLTTKDGAEVTFTKVPETVFCTNVNTGDELMALGLGDKIIYTANNNTVVAEEYRAEYEAIPQLADKPTLEVILDMEPDFVYGRSSAFSETYNTEHDTLSQYGIMSLSSIEGYKLGADLEDVYQDFYNLGKLFQVEDRAEALVNDMKQKVADVQTAVAGQETVKVFVYDKTRDDGAYTCGNNFTATLMEYAGGENIFKDMEKTWQVVSWEEIVERNPDIIVIDDYGDIPLEQKISELKDNPALATVSAIQNDNIISVTLCEVFASSQTANTIEKFARAFHPECF